MLRIMVDPKDWRMKKAEVAKKMPPDNRGNVKKYKPPPGHRIIDSDGVS